LFNFGQSPDWLMFSMLTQSREEMAFSSNAARLFLQDAFSDEEVETFCFDFFREVQKDFSSGMKKGEKINLLLEYCQQHEGVEALFRALQAKRPEQYQKRFGDAPPPAQFEVTFTPSGAPSSVELTLSTLSESAQLKIQMQKEQIAFFRKLEIVLLVVGGVVFVGMLFPNPLRLVIGMRIAVSIVGLLIGSLSGVPIWEIGKNKAMMGQCEIVHRLFERLKTQPVIDAETRALITFWMNQMFEGVMKVKTG
jgi:hypothetical protein